MVQHHTTQAERALKDESIANLISLQLRMGGGLNKSEAFRKITMHELQNMSLIDFVEMFKNLSKIFSEQGLMLDRDFYQQIKTLFIKEAQKSWAKTDRHSHSLTYFLFLSVKLDIFDEDLFKFIVGELFYN
jgi:hypothetical protein